jgi:hypothetical protein
MRKNIKALSKRKSEEVIIVSKDGENGFGLGKGIYHFYPRACPETDKADSGGSKLPKERKRRNDGG